MAVFKVLGSAMISVWIEVDAPSLEVAEAWAETAAPSKWTPTGIVEDTVEVEGVYEDPVIKVAQVKINEEGVELSPRGLNAAYAAGTKTRI